MFRDAHNKVKPFTPGIPVNKETYITPAKIINMTQCHLQKISNKLNKSQFHFKTSQQLYNYPDKNVTQVTACFL